MKRVIVSLFIIFAWLIPTSAHPVDQETAKAVAVKFMGTRDLILSATYQTDINVPAFYVFNTSDGFVIVSADDCETPVIGYSHEGHFDPDNVPVQMEGYLQDFVTRIQYGIENHIEADEVTKRQWQLVKTIGRLNDDKSSKAVGPLLTSKWHQGCLYNSLCPTMTGPCDHAEVGCVAVAMAQIMHYWRYPETGWGSHSYNNAGLTLSADFGNTTYDWDHMPDSLIDSSSDAEIEAVATLLYHCGVSVTMSYTVNGSGAESKDVPNALIHNFNYSRYLHREKKSNDNALWLSMLKKDLDLQRPVYYSGKGNAGHAFVCDGYDDNDLLHFNWGWGGNADGYFSLGNLNPSGYDFNNNNYAIFDIVPDLDLYHVQVIVNPIAGGYVEGSGDYHIHEQCTMVATPAEHYDFFCWKSNGSLLSYSDTISLFIHEDMDDIEACFTLRPIRRLTAVTDINGTCSPTITPSWDDSAIHSWGLLKQFEINGGRDVATDGKYIYVCGGELDGFMFAKYTMDGEFVERFNIEGCHYPSCLTYDGSYFYCNGLNDSNLYIVDLSNKSLVRFNDMHFNFDLCSYDKTKGGFWMNKKTDGRQQEQIVLCTRSGNIIYEGPFISEGSMAGFGLYIGENGMSHLLLKDQEGTIYQVIRKTYSMAIDYSHPLFNCGESQGSFLGKNDGMDALYVVYDGFIKIYRMVNVFTQCKQYRLRRTDDLHTTTIVDFFAGNSYTDMTWNDLENGRYSYGASMVFENDVESDVIWSNPVVKMENIVIRFGDLEVTSENADDIFGDGTAFYDPAKNTLFLEKDFGHGHENAFINTGSVFTIHLDGRVEFDANIECEDPFMLKSTNLDTLKIISGDAESALRCQNLTVNRSALIAKANSADMAVKTNELNLIGCLLAEPKNGVVDKQLGGICSSDGTPAKVVIILPRSGYAIDEYNKPNTINVQKVFENGQIVIIKDGKRYSILGQEIK